MSDWFTSTRTSAFRFVRMDSARSALLREGASPLAYAAALAIVVTLVVLALLIIIPVLIFAGVVFLLSLAMLKIRNLLTGALHRLPRHEGRENVRVRLPVESSDS